MINDKFEIDYNLYNLLFQHVSLLQAKYTRLQPVRMDFYYIKDSDLQKERNKNLDLSDMHKLANTLMTKNLIVAYQWVPEYAEDSGLHFHAAFYINRQVFLNTFTATQAAKDCWFDITGQQGRVNECRNKNYKRKLSELLYDSAQGYKNLLFALSYLAKSEQKIKFNNGQHAIFLSEINEPSPRGKKRAKTAENLNKHLPKNLLKFISSAPILFFSPLKKNINEAERNIHNLEIFTQLTNNADAIREQHSKIYPITLFFHNDHIFSAKQDKKKKTILYQLAMFFNQLIESKEIVAYQCAPKEDAENKMVIKTIFYLNETAIKNTTAFLKNVDFFWVKLSQRKGKIENISTTISGITYFHNFCFYVEDQMHIAIIHAISLLSIEYGTIYYEQNTPVILQSTFKHDVNAKNKLTFLNRNWIKNLIFFKELIKPNMNK
ncbi:hypothetical protein [Thorsellia kenyensis]|uniref:Inovirus Gp2 family protein n=1 Tax=Thorsellia kenyensis TaxID=1549888 RepID=A0ABV6C996_9GAMM